MNTNSDLKRKGRSLFRVERVLLVAVLAMQIFIAWALLHSNKNVESRASQPVVERAVVEDVISATPLNQLSVPSVMAASPFPFRDPFEGVNALFADTVENMARLRSALQIDEGWDGLTVSPAMDMRDDDSNYVVCFSIPDVQPSNIHVFLDGRILMVDAVAPVRGEHYTRMQRFERRVRLPGPVGASDDAYASITNGILRVQIPKGDTNQEPSEPSRLF